MIDCIHSNEKEQCLHREGIKRYFTGQCGMSFTRPCPVHESKIMFDKPVATQLCPSVWQDMPTPEVMSPVEKAEVGSSLNPTSPDFFEGGLSGGSGASRSWDNDPPNSDPTDGGSWNDSNSDDSSSGSSSSDD